MDVISEGRKVHVKIKGKAKLSGCRGWRDLSSGGGGISKVLQEQVLLERHGLFLLQACVPVLDVRAHSCLSLPLFPSPTPNHLLWSPVKYFFLGEVWMEPLGQDHYPFLSPAP